MTLQIVFINCDVLESLRQSDRRLHHADLDEYPGQLYSPRLKNRLTKEFIHIKDSRVAYIHWYEEEQSRYRNIYDFIYDCRANSSNKNYFILAKKSVVESTPLDSPIFNVYIPVSGEKLPSSYPVSAKVYLLQACHILSLWKERGLLNSEKKTLHIANTKVEVEQSLGNHIIDNKNEGWIFNTSTFVIAILIDYYEIEGELPYAQLNFSQDAEYRFKVAFYLSSVLRAFCVNNGRTGVSNDAEDVIRTTIDLLR